MKRVIKKAFKVEIFPDFEMEQLFMQYIGATRFLYNHLLTICNDRYKNGQKKLNKTELQAEIAKLKQDEEYKWLNDIC